jgi:hypothetical protein
MYLNCGPMHFELEVALTPDSMNASIKRVLNLLAEY